jgi:endonuclease-3
VLLFSFGKPVFPVDTHIYRIAKRLGWIEEKVSEAQANALLDGIVPDDIKYRLHLNLIQHGRTICRAQRPRCEICPLTDLCAYFAAQQSNSRTL